MSEGLNKVLLIGNLGQDPELRHTQGGDPVLSLRVATTEKYLDRDGNKQERTEWHDVSMWGKRGEALSRFLSKGSKLYVEGRIETKKYTDRDGNEKYRTGINARDIILLGDSQGGGGRRDDRDRGRDDDRRRDDRGRDDRHDDRGDDRGARRRF